MNYLKTLLYLMIFSILIILYSGITRRTARFIKSITPHQLFIKCPCIMGTSLSYFPINFILPSIRSIQAVYISENSICNTITQAYGTCITYKYDCCNSKWNLDDWRCHFRSDTLSVSTWKLSSMYYGKSKFITNPFRFTSQTIQYRWWIILDICGPYRPTDIWGKVFHTRRRCKHVVSTRFPQQN